VAAQVTSLGPLDLHHRDPGGLQVASESGSVAAGPFYPGASYGTEALSPTQESFVPPRCGRHLQLTQASLPNPSRATATFTSRWVSTPKTTWLVLSVPSTPLIARTFATPSEVAVISTGPRRRRTDDTVRGHVSGTLLLAHEAPATGGCGATSRIDRGVTLKAHRARG
jgi:hypothetical protein